VQRQDRIVDLEEQVERDQLEAEDEAKKLQDMSQKLEHAEAEVQRKGQTISSLEEKVKRLEIELRDTAAEAAKQAAVLARTKQENQRMDVEIETLTTKGKKMQAECDTMEKRIVEIDHKLLLAHDEVEAEQKASMEKSREIDFFKSELEAAKIDVEKMSLQNAELQKWKPLCFEVQR
jgi:chromosome segregation ATPase